MNNVIRFKNAEKTKEIHVGRNEKSGCLVVGMHEVMDESEFGYLIQMQLTAEQETELLRHLFTHQGPVLV